MLHLFAPDQPVYGRSRTSTTRCIKTTEQMGSYLMAKFAWSDYERAMLVSLDSRKRVRAAVWLREWHLRPGQSGYQERGGCCHQGRYGCRGALPQPPQWGSAALAGGAWTPPAALPGRLGLVNVHLLDHFILTDTEYFSMRDANRLPIYDFKTGTLFWP